MDKCTFCAGGPEAATRPEEFAKYGRNRLAEGKLPVCAEMCSTKALLAGDGATIGAIYKERVLAARLRLGRLGLVHRLSRQPDGLRSAMRHLRLLLAAYSLGHAARLGQPSWRSNCRRTSPTTDRAALEQKLEGATAMPPGKIQGFVHIPDDKDRRAGPAGRPRASATFGRGGSPGSMPALIVIAVGAMLACSSSPGRCATGQTRPGRTIQRFTAFERFVHWLTAVSFVWLALTGLNLVFGRYLLRPLIGDDRSPRFALGKLSHNAVGFPFMLGLAS